MIDGLCVNLEPAYPFTDAVVNAFVEFGIATSSAYHISADVENVGDYDCEIEVGFPALLVTAD